MTPATLLTSLALTEYLPAFEENAIDSDTLRSLSDADLKDLGVAKLGHRKKILEAIAADGSSHTHSPAAAPSAASPVSPALDALVAHAPSFIAAPLGDALHEPHPVLRLWAMCDSLEMLLRFLAVSLLAEKQAAGALDPKLVSKFADLIAAPTLGAWFVMAQALEPSDGSVFSEVPEFIEKSLKPLLYGPAKKDQANPETSFLKLRNRLAHGGGLPRKEGERLLAHWWPRFESAMAAALWIQDFGLIGRGSASAGAPGNFLRLDGIGEPVPYDVPPGMTFPEAGSLWLVRGARQIQLWPLAIFARAAMEDLGSARRSPSAHAQIYSRQESVWLAYTPLGAEGFIESHGGQDEWRAFQEMFAVKRTGQQQVFKVPGFEKELRKESAEMVGRSAEIARALEEIQARTAGLVWITGPAGMGKSFLMARLFAELTETADATRHVFAYRFRAGDDRRCNRDAFALFLDERLRDAGLVRKGFEAEKDAKPEERLETAFNGLPLDQHLTLLLDGLDEVVRTDPKFVEEMIGDHPQVRWVCAGRPEPALVKAMRERGATDLFPDGLPPMAEDDIRGMILNKIGPLRRKLLQQDHENAGQVLNPFVSLVTRRAGGLPLYVKYVIGDVLSGKYRVLDGAEDLPESLHAYHEKLLKQLGIGDLEAVLGPVVAALALAHEPLEEGELHAFLACRKLLPADESGQSLLARGLAALASMLKTAPDPDGQAGFVLFHNSLRDHVRDSPTMAITVRQTREAFADLAEEETPPDRLEKYLLRCGVDHLLEGQRAAAAERTLLSLARLGEMAKAGVGWLPVYRWWMALGGEERAIGYLRLLGKRAAWDDAQIMGVALLLSVCLQARWIHVGLPLANADFERTECYQGHQHPDTLRRLGVIANFLVEKGDFAEARTICSRLLCIWRVASGAEHPEALRALSNLAVISRLQGNLDEGRELCRRTLEARQRVLGDEHPDTLTSMSNLAVLLSEQGDFEGAVQMGHQVVEARKRVLGNEHPDTLDSLNNLALYLSKTGNILEAESLCQRAFTTSDRVLGATHPGTIRTLQNLLQLTVSNGDIMKSQRLCRRLHSAMEQTYGPNHPDTVSIIQFIDVLANL